MSNLQAIPVTIENGVVRTADGSPLPENANGVLVILPETAGPAPTPEWQRAFDAYLATLRTHPPRAPIDELSEEELNRIVHEGRSTR